MVAFSVVLRTRPTGEMADGHVELHQDAYDAIVELRTAVAPLDSTATGRSVLNAADATAARTAIGAGTSSLALGTTASTAAAGNHSHTTYALKTAVFTIVTTTSGAYPSSRPTNSGPMWFDDPAVTPPAWAIDGDRWAAA